MDAYAQFMEVASGIDGINGATKLAAASAEQRRRPHPSTRFQVSHDLPASGSTGEPPSA
jgi:hypothetical protein